MAGTGGLVRIQWGLLESCAVTITGNGSFTHVGVGAASFPVTLTGSASFTTTSDGDYTVSVKFLGREILSKSLRLQGDNGVILNAEPSHNELVNALFPVTSTTTALEDVDAAVNTAGKYAGKVLFNTTTGVLLVADGPDADDTWSTAAGVATHTPV